MTARLAIIALAALLAFAGAARAQDSPPPEVAVLPLDAGERLEIYGQAVATELSRALLAGGIVVDVVGPKEEVPTGARLIVDGSLTQEKGGAIKVALRVREHGGAGRIFDTLSASAPTLAQIDRAAAELADRVVPVVRARVAELAAERPPPRRPADAPRVAAPLVLVGVTAQKPRLAPLRTALTEATDAWASAARREARTLDPKLPAPKAVAAAQAERAVAFEILDYDVTRKHDVPLARARVRVRISDDRAVRFERVVRTDTVVGARGMRDDALAALVAQEVLAILRPHMRKLSGWP